MLFKQMKVFLVDPMPECNWQEALALYAQKPLMGQSEQNIGWSSPYGAGAEDLCYSYGHFVLMNATFQRRLLPAAVINQMADDQVLELEQKENRSVGRQEKKRIKEAVRQELISQAFVKRKNVRVLLNIHAGWVVFDTVNADESDRILALLQDTFADFSPARLGATDVAERLTRWVSNHAIDGTFALDEDCVMVSKMDKRNALRMSAQDLSSEEVKSALNAGKRVHKLGMIWKDRMSFMVDEDLNLNRIRLKESLNEDEVELGENLSEMEKLARDFLLVAPYYQQLLADFFTLFEVKVPETSHVE